MTEFVKVAGVETPVEVAQILNKIIDEKGNVDLDNLSEVGEKRFSDLSSSITNVKNSVSSLTTTVNGKIGATVSKAANGYIKFTNGMIIQWGSIFSSQFAKDYVKGTFTFPVAMVPVCVISTACNEGDIITVRDWTTAGFNYSIHDRLPQYEAYISFSWFAVGF